MQDARFDKLASLLVDYSTELKHNEKVLIECFDTPDEMTIALIRAVRKAKAIPFVQIQSAQVTRELALEIDPRGDLTQIVVWRHDHGEHELIEFGQRGWFFRSQHGGRLTPDAISGLTRRRCCRSAFLSA